MALADRSLARRATSLPKRVLRRLTLGTLGTVTSVATEVPAVALTFDDGPHPDSTPAFLDILARHGARATFFMVGSAAAGQPELLRRVADEGHAIGNHTFDHPSLPLLGPAERRRQLRAGARALEPYGAPLFRPPFGHQSLASRLDALRLGYTVVAWSGHLLDWEARDADWFAERLESRLEPGAIVLMHDALFRSDNTAAVDRRPLLAGLERVLARHAGRIRFVTVPELLALGRPRRRHWYKHGDADWLAMQRPIDELDG